MNLNAMIWDRLSNDVTLSALLASDGVGPYVVPDWPDDTLTAADFPRIVYTIPTDDLNRAIRAPEIQFDIFVDRNSDLGLVEQIDNRLRELLHEQLWTYSGNRVYGYVIGGGARPSDKDTPYHYMRTVRFHTS